MSPCAVKQSCRKPLRHLRTPWNGSCSDFSRSRGLWAVWWSWVCLRWQSCLWPSSPCVLDAAAVQKNGRWRERRGMQWFRHSKDITFMCKICSILPPIRIWDFGMWWRQGFIFTVMWHSFVMLDDSLKVSKNKIWYFAFYSFYLKWST